MAIISIPSSIGGITVPGLATNGPLGLLFNNPFATLNLQYPRDLQSTARGHYVTFLVKDIVPIGYEGSVTSSLNAGANIFTNVIKGISGSDNQNTETSIDLKLTPKTYVDRASISL
jgi:hypothetical protein